MKEYQVPKTENTGAVCWGKVPEAVLQHTGWLKENDVQAKGQVCHDENNLYVRLEAREQNIRAEVTDPMEQVCTDSCLEFFFAPMENDARYFNFEFNPIGSMYLGFGGPRETRVRQHPGNTKQFQIAPFKTECGWGVTFRVPLDYIRLYFPEFSFSGVSACNFYKCGEQTASPHYLAWSPLTCSNPDYHRRNDFGRMIFA